MNKTCPFKFALYRLTWLAGAATVLSATSGCGLGGYDASDMLSDVARGGERAEDGTAGEPEGTSSGGRVSR